MKWWYPVFSAAGVVMIVGTSEYLFGPNLVFATLMVAVCCMFYLGILLVIAIDNK